MTSPQQQQRIDHRTDLSAEQAVAQAEKAFPFPGYFNYGGALASEFLAIAQTVERVLPRGSSILDFGCGPCDKVGVLSRMGYECSGLDDLNDAWHRRDGNLEAIHRFAEESGVELVDSGEINAFEGRQFDMVMSHAVLEHLHDSPRMAFESLVELVRPGGLVYVSVPNAVNLRKRISVARGRTNYAPYGDYYWYPGSWRGHVREYVKGDLAAFAEALNLEVVELGGCDHMLASLSTNPLVQRTWKLATARMDSLKDSVYLVAAKPLDWEPRLPPQGLLDTFLNPHSA